MKLELYHANWSVCAQTVRLVISEKRLLSLLSAAAASGQQIRYPSPEICKHTAEQYEKQGCGAREWPSLIRQLDAVTSEYKY